jgi:phospholipid/cholesterol/gamma-HCH transport system permease protein
MTSIEEDADAPDHGWLRIDRQPRLAKLAVGGHWTIGDAARLDPELRALDTGEAREVEIDGSAITRLDSAGAWLIVRTKRAIEDSGRRVSRFVMPELYVPLVHDLDQTHTAPPVHIAEKHTFEARLIRIGKATIHAGKQGLGILGYLGRVTVETGEAIYSPRGNLRVAALVHQVEETGINALPIVGLLSFLIGIVLAYQAIDQLKQFGAETLTVNGLGIIILREMGVLMTSIIVAGRSGSAFTAQIGTMRVNEEIDAMQTMGLNTVDALVLPRMLGLVIALPLLTLYADIMGMVGGAIMCDFDLGMTIPVFLRQLQGAINVNTLMVGLIKAPVFAFIISLVGCYEGFQVERNAASVGMLTTRSVVESIFLVIVFDAGFSILFSVLGI